MALPAGYSAVPYLEATGTQYIDTMYRPSDNATVIIDAEFTQTPSGHESLFGYEDITGNEDTGYAVGIYNLNGEIRYLFTNGEAAIVSPYATGRHIYETRIIDSRIHLFIDGDDVTSNGGILVSGKTGTQNAYLFASHFVSGSQDIAWQEAHARIYEATVLSASSSVMRHMIPARRDSDGKLGMYDDAFDFFFVNRGSGSFLTETMEPPASITVPGRLTVGEAFPVTWGASPAEGVTAYLLERSVNGGSFEQIYSGTAYMVSETPASGWTKVQYRVRVTDGENFSSYAESPLRNVVDPYAPTSPNYSAQYKAYLAGLLKPYKKVVRLEFLQPDDTVAFALGGAGQKTPIPGRDTRCFLQSGSVSVNLANGPRRKASVVLANRDGAFDYAIGKLWFGQRVRLSMGMRLPDGEDFYFPMGVFYIENPSNLFTPGERTTTLSLTDKWAYLDGSLFGVLESAYSVDTGTNIYSAIDSLLHLSKRTYTAASDAADMIDPAKAVYTTYYNNKSYLASKSDGSISSDISMTSTPYTITENHGSTMGAVILKLNEMLAGWIGYDASGALRLEPSQDDIDDADKPVLFGFTPENSVLVSMTESAQTGSVYNDVTIAGQGLTNSSVWARAVNVDPASDTNINLIGRRVYTEEKADYWNTDQCAALARWYLKRKTVLQKAVTVECGQMFHLVENRLISVKRPDKLGSPVEKHLIQGFTIPVGETGSMSISCVSVNDIPEFTVTTSVSS